MPKKKIISQPAPDTEPRPVPAPKSRKKAMPEAAAAAAVRLPLRTEPRPDPQPGGKSAAPKRKRAAPTAPQPQPASRPAPEPDYYALYTPRCTRPYTISSRGRAPNGDPNPVDVHIGKRLRMRREMLGFSQDKLASMLGLTFQQVQKYERGTNRIGGSRLWDISQILGVDISFFYQEMDKDTRLSSPRHYILNFDTIMEESEVTATDPMKNQLNCKMITFLEKIPNRKSAKGLYMLAASMASTAYGCDKSEEMGKLFDKTEEKKAKLKQK